MKKTFFAFADLQPWPQKSSIIKKMSSTVVTSVHENTEQCQQGSIRAALIIIKYMCSLSRKMYIFTSQEA